MRVSCCQSARTIRAEASGRMASVARVTSPDGEKRVGIVSEHEAHGVFPAGARPDTVRESAVLGEARAAQGLADLVDAHLSRGQRLAKSRQAMLERPGGLAGRVARRLGVCHRGRDGRELLIRPGHRLGGGLRRGEQSRGFRFRFRSVALARGQLLADFHSGFVDPRERRRHALGGEIDLVAGIPRGDPFAGGIQGLRPRFLEVPLEREAGGRGLRSQAIGFFAGERAGARFGDRPRQALLEVGEVPRRPGLLGREVAAFPLQGGAARGEIQRRAAVGLEQGVVPRDGGFERRQGFPHRVAARRGLARLEARGGQGRFGARESGRGLGFPVPPLVAKFLARGERFAQPVARARA